MSESGHSQPGMYGQGRRRRRRRGDRDVGPPGQNLSGPSRDREYQPRERRVTSTLASARIRRHSSISGVGSDYGRNFCSKIVTLNLNFSLQDGSEDPPGPLIQKTPIILAKPPGERVCLVICDTKQ